MLRVESAPRFAALLALVILTACGDATGSTERVVSIVLQNVPAAPLLTGASVQLAATTLNGSGVVITGRQVAWKSSDARLATVSSGGLVTGVAAGVVTVTASADGAETAVTVDVRAGGSVGPQGGTLSLLGGAMVLDVPAHALSQTVVVLARPAVDAPASARMLPGTAVEITPESLGFFPAARLSLRFGPAGVPAGLNPGSLQLYQRAGTEWRIVDGSGRDSVGGAVSGSIRGTGTYAILSTPVNSIALQGSCAGGALYASQSCRLRADAYDVRGTPLSGARVEWSSSDAAVLGVDSLGFVTALGAGQATITARADDAVAATAIHVMARPTASWSHTRDWTTFQGNESRTGYVAATLDPVVFRELWNRQVFAAPLNPVVTGNGRVYVSINSYFGGQWAFGLSASTGAQLWSHSFGDIHSVHPPAYANGNVYLTTGGHGDSYLHALDGATGVRQFRTAYGNQWSRWYAPAIVDGAVYMAGGYYGGMYSFDASTGAQRWFAGTNQYDEWAPAVADGRVYAYTGSYSPRLQVFSAATGAEEFSIVDPEFSWTGWSMHVAPVLGSRNNVVAAHNGRLLSFDLQARTVGWTRTGGFTGTVAVGGGRVYARTSNGVEARTEADGGAVWQWTPPSGSPQHNLVVTENLLFVSVPTPYGDGPGTTYAIDIAAGRQVWSYPLAGHLTLGDEGTLFIASANSGRLAAIRVR